MDPFEHVLDVEAQRWSKLGVSKTLQCRKKTRKAETETVELNTSLLYTRNKKLLGTPGIAARSKDAATRGSWPYY